MPMSLTTMSGLSASKCASASATDAAVVTRAP
jgi:hypothetical protein